MNRKRTPLGRLFGCVIGLLFAAELLFGGVPSAAAQAKPATQLDVADGSKATYRVREQLAGLNFPDDAIGSTDSITGSVVILPDGTVDSAKSKLTIDLRNLKSDQDMRDGFVKNRTLETDKFPTAEFVPKRLQGVTFPLPAPDRPTGQTGFQLVGDLTVHGVTKEVTLNGYATYSKDLVAGRANTDFTFATFGLTKPSLARLLSVDDKIQLDLEFKLKRTN
jgi:polyisoprenoid-binding protein YceI